MDQHAARAGGDRLGLDRHESGRRNRVDGIPDPAQRRWRGPVRLRIDARARRNPGARFRSATSPLRAACFLGIAAHPRALPGRPASHGRRARVRNPAVVRRSGARRRLALMSHQEDRSMDDSKPNVNWIRAIDTAQLRQRGRAVVKLDGKQLALFAVGDRVFACNNRCPHEGYPLVEGHLAGATSDQCMLTCNWHNWKFELATGHNVYGGDALRMYPTRLAQGAVWVEVAEAPQDQRVQQAYERLRHAMDENQYDRIAREVARLAKAGADPRGAVVRAIVWSHGRLRDGMTHAYAAANGWLRLHETLHDPVEQLTCLAESVGHIAFDTLREADWPYCADEKPWNDATFAAAVAAQDEDAAVAQLRGALAAGISFSELEPALARAALAHYNDFGHSLIYLRGCGGLIERLGGEVQAPLLLAYVRSLVRATREDLIPEFRKYAEALSRWNAAAPEPAAVPDPNAWVGLSINRALDAAVAVRKSTRLNSSHTVISYAVF